MIIHSVKLENFKQYYGEQEILLSPDIIKENVTVINGKNGAGKTNFFTAINWCFYGEDVVKIEGELINKNKLQKAKYGEVIATKVVITFSHESKQYLIIRKYCVKKVDKETYTSMGPTQFEMFEIDKDNSQQKEIGNPLNTLNIILPSDVRTYFLFDGERIDEFAKIENKDEVWEAVRKVLKLRILERAQQHLESIALEYTNELKRYSEGKLSELLTKDEELKNKRDTLYNSITRIKDEIKGCQRLIDEIEQRQGEIKEIEELTTAREKIRIERNSNSERLKDVKKELKKYLSQAYYIFAVNSLSRAESYLEGRVDENRLDYTTLKQLYKNIIKSQKCICGRDVRTGTKEYQYLMDQIPHQGNEEKDFHFFNRINNNIKVCKQNSNEYIENIREKYLKRRELENEIEILDQKEDDINSKLKESQYEDAAKLQIKRDGYIEKRTKLKSEYDNINKQLIDVNSLIEDLKIQIDKEESNKKEVVELKKRKLLSEKCTDVINELYENFKIEMRSKIEEKASDIFQTLIRKKQSFEKVVLTEDFQLKLVDRFGDTNARSEISAGERQVLSLAFILGLAKVSDCQSSLIMDTPFGRLDSDHRKNIIKAIPNLTPQLILFVTDEELDDDNRLTLKNRMKFEYLLDFDDSTGNTTIKRER